MVTPIGYQQATKAFLAGTHRLRHPEETWDIVRPRLKDYGITRVADVTGLDTIGIPVAMAIRPLTKTLSVSQGKGQTLVLAKVSAAMESIEIWHAEYACPPATHRRVPAAELGLMYRLADVTARRALLTDSTPLNWVDAVGMLSGETVPVPIDLVCFTAPHQQSWSPPGLQQTSNGLASGNCRPEAALHALYEIIERDAISLQPFETGERHIDPDSIDDPGCSEMIEQIHRAGATLTITHLASRFGVPCFGAQLWSEDFAVTSLGWGAHLAPDIAVSRAITEAAQGRLTMIAGSRDDLPPLYHYVKTATGKALDPPAARARWSDSTAAAHESFADLSEELSWLCQATERVTGIEPLLVDLSTDSDFSVVKVIAPGTALDIERIHPEDKD